MNLTYEQAAWFRAKRSGLVTPFSTLSEAATAILGAQAQVEAPARWALAMRTAGTPAASVVKAALCEHGTLVRAWGQRDTVHMYAPDDWHLFATANDEWTKSARRGGMCTDEELADFISLINGLGRAFTRSDLLGAAPPRLVQAFIDEPVNNDPPERMAITRLIWKAGRAGALSSVDTIGREQSYMARATWLPDIAWPTISSLDANKEIVRRYLRTWGPATVHDIAHYTGANVSTARAWVAGLGDEVFSLSVEGVPDHLAHVSDTDALKDLSPPSFADWPARMLPAYDTQMMTHANKDFVVPDPAHRPLVWGKAALVFPTVIAGGRFVATWKHKAAKKKVDVNVEPMPAAPALGKGHIAGDLAAFEAHLLG